MHMPKLRTADAAIGRWPGILQALGVDARHVSNRHGPCPICAGKDRYRFDDKDGRGTWICSHCGAGDGFRLLELLHGWGFADAARRVDEVVGTIAAGPVTAARSDDSKCQALRSVWAESRAVTRGDPVWTYLHRRVGLDVVPAALRFHPSLRYVDQDGTDLGRFPAMLARMAYPDGSGASIHRTYLTEAGEKAAVPSPKKMMPGKPLKTAAVALSEVRTSLGIAEGIETALAASKRFGVPVWAATNAVLLADWVPPAGVKQVLIAADHDASFTGQEAAYSLARRLVRDGIAVEIQMPDAPGKDWADERL